MSVPSDELVQTLAQHNQQHVLKWWEELNPQQQLQLTSQLEAIDLPRLMRVWKAAQSEQSTTHNDAELCRADRAAAPTTVVRQPVTEQDIAKRQAAGATGEQLLADGKVAVITVAGGQGSRLGFDEPKGMFPIGPASNRTLFQIFAEQIQARQQRHGGTIPWLIMTSQATHEDTVQFFQQQQYFGLNADHVHFFQQGSMPAVDADTGRLLMQDKASLCLSPDGHGGLVAALQSSGLLNRMAAAGIELLFYHQVDNPTVILCDPVLLGLHHQHDSELSTNVVQKTSPTERMGALAEIDGHLEIIEYSELTEDQASRTDDSGQFVFWAGNTAIHVFSRTFFEHLASEGGRLKLHLANKKVPHIDDCGNLIDPTEPNASKFERFIFDALPLARNALIVEGNRALEFNPVKNAEGDDSPATARAALNRIGRNWLEAAGHSVSETATVEISPLVALDLSELSDKLARGAASLDDLVHNVHDSKARQQ